MYSTQVNGKVLEFGTSGFLYRSNKLMYDRGTNTLWKQFLGEPVVGPLADSDIKLELLPSVVTTWGEWVTAHPDTTVLDIETGLYPPELYLPESHPRSPYYSYRVTSETMFPVWQHSDLLPAKAQVLGLNVNGHAKAYPLSVLAQEPVVNDSVGGQNVVVVTEGAFPGARAYVRGSYTFSLAPSEGEEEAIILLDQEGRRWRMEEDGLVQVAQPSERLQRLPSHNAYWFGWYAFYPATKVYGVTTS